MIVDALPEGPAGSVSAAILEAFRKELMVAPVVAPALDRDDYVGAFGVFLVVVLSTFPIVLPFVFITDTPLAMRVPPTLNIQDADQSLHSLGGFAREQGVMTYSRTPYSAACSRSLDVYIAA